MKDSADLNLKFKNKKLLDEALTHKSHLNEAENKKLPSNERLEFLGDAVLSLVTSKFLYQKFPNLEEGDLTNLRASLVNTQTLAIVSGKINLGEYLLLSRGEEEGGGRTNPGILADTFEALIGALYLDDGLETAADFISKNLFPQLKEIISSESIRDYKSLLQEKVQRQKKVAPLYRVLKTEGPAHKRIFSIGVYIDNQEYGQGTGHSKQEAEQEAAKMALEKLSQIK